MTHLTLRSATPLRAPLGTRDCSGPLPRSPFYYMVVTDPSLGRATWHATTTLTPAKHLQVVSRR